MKPDGIPAMLKLKLKKPDGIPAMPRAVREAAAHPSTPPDERFEYNDHGVFNVFY